MTYSDLGADTNRNRRPFAIAALAVFLAGALFVVAMALAFAGNSVLSREILLRVYHLESVTTHKVVYQQTAFDCGPAAVANILALAHRPYNIDDLEHEMRPTFVGTPIATLARTLNNHGIAARVEHLPKDALRSASMPLIILSSHHYVVVVTKVSPDRLEVLDPSVGDIVEPIENVERSWRGWAVVTKEKAHA
jgi:predicted double-glycine peptidase